MSIEGKSQAQFSIAPSELPVDEFVYKFGPEVCDLKPLPKLLRVTEEDKHVGCDHCYVFEDYNPNARPLVMDKPTIVKYAERIAEHADQHKLSIVRAVMHGGEALLYPKKIDEAATALRGLVECEVGLSIVTNGWRPIEEHIDMLKKHDFKVGVSINGGREAHFRHRRGPHGEDIYDEIVHTTEVLRRSGLEWGILTVFDPRDDPEQVIEDLAALKPHDIKLFPSLIRDPEAEGDPNILSLGQWQVRAFARYRDWEKHHPGDKAPPFTMSRFDDYAAVFAGFQAEQQDVGGRPWQEMFMNPNCWGRIDTLAPGARGVHMTAFNPNDHSVDYVLAHDPGYIAQRGGRGTLPVDCRECPLVEACGGDYYPHRGNQAKLAKLTTGSTPMEFAEAYGDVSPLCEEQKIFLPVIAEAVEVAQGWPKGILTGQIETPDDVEQLVEPIAFEAKEVALAAAASLAPKESDITLVAPGRGESVPYRAPRALVSSIANWRAERAMVHEAIPDAGDDIAEWLLDYPRYDVFPLGIDPNLWRQRAPRVWKHEKIIEAIEAGELYGKLAAHAYKACYPSTKFYSVPATSVELSQIPAERDALSHRNVSDAVVTALLNKEQPTLRGIPFRLAKVGDYWLVTGNAVRALAAQATEAFGTLVALSPGHMERGVLSDFSNAVPLIKAGFTDLPNDLLVLDMPATSAEETSLVFDEVVSTFTSFPNPEQLSLELSKRPGLIHLRPFAGIWPSVRGEYRWQDTSLVRKWRPRKHALAAV